MKTFPKTIWVTEQGESDDKYLAVGKHAYEFAEIYVDVPVAEYQLVDHGVVSADAKFSSKMRGKKK